jgi:hypothetical protein
VCYRGHGKRTEAIHGSRFDTINKFEARPQERQREKCERDDTQVLRGSTTPRLCT